MLKYRVRIPTSGDTNINVPISMENQMVDQSDIIETKFVDVEVEKSINPIIDYEKVKFKPYTSGKVDKVRYNLNFINGQTYSDIGFDNDDLLSHKNSFTQSFLRLNFYDTDDLSVQRLISFITIFSTIYDGETISASKPLTFDVVSDRVRSQDPSEGFNLFHFADEVGIGAPKELFMRAEFNNAKDGKTTNFMVKDSVVGIENLVNQLHTKYILKKDNTIGYYYEVEPLVSPSNVNISPSNVNNGSTVTVNLWEVDSL